MRSRTWHFLFGWSHKNPLRSLIFQVLKRLFGTNVESVMSEGERNPERRMERPVANEANEMSGENVSKNLKTSVILTRIFVTITPNKKCQRPWSNMRYWFSPFHWDPPPQVQPTSQLAALKPSPACSIIPTRPSPFQDITNVSRKRKHEEVRETTVVVRSEAENTASMATQLTKQQAYFQEMLLKQQLEFQKLMLKLANK